MNYIYEKSHERFKRLIRKIDTMLFTDDFVFFLQDPFKYQHKLTAWKARRKFFQNHHKMQRLTKQTEVWAVQSEDSDNPLSSSEDEQPNMIKK